GTVPSAVRGVVGTRATAGRDPVAAAVLRARARVALGAPAPVVVPGAPAPVVVPGAPAPVVVPGAPAPVVVPGAPARAAPVHVRVRSDPGSGPSQRLGESARRE